MYDLTVNDSTYINVWKQTKPAYGYSEVRMVATFGRREGQEGFWGASNVLLIGLDAN